MALLAISISVPDPAGISTALEAATEAAGAGADLVEWRVDALAGSSAGHRAVGQLVSEAPLPCILTCRHASEGGAFPGPESDRIALLTDVVEAGAWPRYVDVEVEHWQSSAKLRETVGALRAGGECGLILSMHDFDGRPADLSRRLDALWSVPEATVVKVAWRARSVRDAVEITEVLSNAQGPMIALSMDRFGVMTRILTPKFGGLLTFAAETPSKVTAPGQLTLEDLTECYRFRDINRSTRIYGILGDPVEHSVSPRIHNAGFLAAGHNGVMVPMPVIPGWESLKASLITMLDQDGFGLAGLCVTLPHKEHLLRFVRESGGTISATAERVGAANTLVVEDNGHLFADNTDVRGVRLPLERHRGLRGTRVAILGAGGAARAAVVAVLEAGGRVTVLNRNAERAAVLVEDIRLAFGNTVDLTVGELKEIGSATFDIIVNATSVGMQGGPDPSGSPWSLLGGATEALGPGVTVFDTVYAPRETPLIRQARAAGASVITGDEMFLAQAAAQFKRWTGVAPDLDQWTHLLR